LSMFISHSLNIRGKLTQIESPWIMGILNVTPDSFSDGGRYNDTDKALAHAEKLWAEGADLLDIGGASSRPGAETVSVETELSRVLPVLRAIKKKFPEGCISIDTWRQEVARQCMEEGADIINDISGGRFEPGIWEVAASAQAPYILMHMQGTPGDMQLNPNYRNVVLDIQEWLSRQVFLAQQAGLKDIIIDPGFGFGKTEENNIALFQNLENFTRMGHPLLVGVSRKAMVRQLSGAVKKEELSEANAILHYQAMEAGAGILRVHEVRTTVIARNMWLKFNASNP